MDGAEVIPAVAGRSRQALWRKGEILGGSITFPLRTAQANNADVAQREQKQMQQALQSDPLVVAGKPIPILCVAKAWDRYCVPFVRVRNEIS